MICFVHICGKLKPKREHMSPHHYPRCKCRYLENDKERASEVLNADAEAEEFLSIFSSVALEGTVLMLEKMRPGAKYLTLRPMQWQIWKVLSVTHYKI